MTKFIIPILLLIFSIASASVLACSRVFYAATTPAVMVARNMDWNMLRFGDLMQTNIIVYPRGIKRDGNTKENPLHWVAQYGSIVATALHDQVATDGMNERGLAAHTLWFELADYGDRDITRPGLSITRWVQFFLDNFQTVNEAVAYVKSNTFQITSLNIPGSDMAAPQHLVLEDADGDSAIVEYIAGKPVIYHDTQYVVATNEPSYSKQLKNLLQYQGFGGKKPLPGSLMPQDRFVRAAYYLSRMPKPVTVQDEVAKLFSVLQSVAEPNEIVSAETPNPIPTVWQVVADLSHKTYYFHATNKMNLIWVELSKFNLQHGEKSMRLDLSGDNVLTGDVSDQFKPMVELCINVKK